MGSQQVFISYSRADEAFADRLRLDLLSIGLSVWKDDKEIKPGNSSSKSIEQAINASDYFLLVQSVSSSSSNWVDREYRSALQSQMEKGKPRIVPIRLHDVEPPALLRDIQYADFANDYAVGWTELSKLFPSSDLRDLRLGGATGMGIHLLKLFIAKWRRRFSNLPIQERVDISERLIESVADTGLDAAVVGRMPGNAFKETVECKEVFRDRSVLTIFPSHPLWGKESLSEEELAALFRGDPVFVSRPKGAGLYEAVTKYLEPRLGRNRADELLDRFVAYDLDSVRTFVCEGRGISILPSIIVKEDVLSGKIWAVGLPGNVDRSFYGVWAKDRPRSPVAEEFIALLKAGLE
jgi:DNA-binding transcriptional LysR family regulator